jgi:hypothetical protein
MTTKRKAAISQSSYFSFPVRKEDQNLVNVRHTHTHSRCNAWHYLKVEGVPGISRRSWWRVSPILMKCVLYEHKQRLPALWTFFTVQQGSHKSKPHRIKNTKGCVTLMRKHVSCNQRVCSKLHNCSKPERYHILILYKSISVPTKCTV